MDKTLINNNSLFSISLPEIFRWLWFDRLLIIFITITFGLMSVLYALSIENKYSSKVTVISNLEDSKSLGGSLGGLSGIASMAGLSLGGSNMSPEVLKEILTSDSFLGTFIKKQKIEPIIMAAKSYDPESKEFNFDEKVYDISNERWVREYYFPQELEPNEIELAEKFKENFSANYDRKTKLISMVYNSYSPSFSQEILIDLVNEFNSYIKKQERETAVKTIEYLKSELRGVVLSEVKTTMQALLEEQYKKLSIAETRNDYALKVIGSPLVAYNKSEPKRAVICFVITLFGLITASLISISYRIIKRR